MFMILLFFLQHFTAITHSFSEIKIKKKKGGMVVAVLPENWFFNKKITFLLK